MDLQRNRDKVVEKKILELVNEIAELWDLGTFEIAKEKAPLLYQAARKKEKFLNSTWIKYRKGQATYQDLEKAIEEWFVSLKEILKLKNPQS